MNCKSCIHCGADLHEAASFCHACESAQTEKVRPVVICPIGRNLRILLLANVLTLAVLLVVLLHPSLFPARTEQKIPEVGAATDQMQKEPETTFKTEYISDYEAIYTEDGVAYRIGVSFGDKPVYDEEGAYYTATIGTMDSYIKWTHIYAVRESDGKLMQTDFVSMVESVCVERYHAVSGEFCGSVSAEVLEPQMHPSAMQVGMFFDAYTGKQNLVWHVRMKSGEELIFRQTMEIFQTARVAFTPDNASMGTIEELRALIEHIEATEPMDTEVLIYLPAVVYDGGLQLNRSYSFYGSTDGNVATTFTDTVVCAAPEPQSMRFTDIVFDGGGRGVGILDLCGTELHCCTLRNWDVAAKTGETGWILSFLSNFVHNGTAIEFNSIYSWYNISEYPNNSFVGNDAALVINRIVPMRTLVFPGSVFRDNGKNIVNYTTQTVDLSSAVVE